jgi:hypothetical protein
MSVTIEEFKGKYEASNIAEFEIVLNRRYGPEVNGFWMSHSNQRHPALSLLVKGSLSTLLYVPTEGHPGFAPVGRTEGLDSEEFTMFSVDTIEQELEVSNGQVVNILEAVAAARDFFASIELPKAIRWQEL